jgi:glycosyltransferase involved in cell wall biosynthesis
MKVKELISDSVWMPGSLYESSTPKVTILLPTYSRGRDGSFLRAVDSLLNQTTKEIELIIIDDASTDGTFDQIKKIMEYDGRVSCIRHQHNIGLPAISEYEGFIKSKGDFFFFGFDDNLYELDGIENLLDYATENEQLIVRGKCRYPYMGVINELPNLDISALWATNFIANSSVLVHRKVLEDVGLYDPHLLIVRLCDFDLWRRVVCKYEFPFVDELVTTENGMINKGSLGNTRFMDNWAANEFMGYSRNAKLRPENYAEYEIDFVDPKFTSRTQSLIHTQIVEYNLRHTDILINNNSNSIQSNDTEKILSENNIILLTDNYITASELLCFDDLPETIRSRILFINPNYWRNELFLLANCSILIVSRRVDNELATIWVDGARDLSIPIYYYSDDNLVELGNYTHLQMKNYMKEYAGILTTSQNLMDEYVKKKLHKNIQYFPISMASRLYDRKDFNTNNPIRIAFMGGGFREKALKECVIPALNQISQNIPIEVFLPDSVRPNTSKIDFSGNVKIVYYKRDISYYPVINFLKRRNIDILVHPSVPSQNNKYKTENSLINACMIGAVLVASDEYPYKSSSKEILTSVENLKEGWVAGLLPLIQSSEERKNKYHNALEYCRNTYNGKLNEEIITKLLGVTKPISTIDELTRYKNIVLFMSRRGHQISFSQDYSDLGYGRLIKLFVWKLLHTPIKTTIMVILGRMKRRNIEINQ